MDRIMSPNYEICTVIFLLLGYEFLRYNYDYRIYQLKVVKDCDDPACNKCMIEIMKGQVYSKVLIQTMFGF